MHEKLFARCMARATRIPELPKQRLTTKRVRELMTEPPHFLNLVAVFGDQHYDEFLTYVAERYPELVQRWWEEALEHDPTLRAEIFKQMNHK